MFSAGIPGSRNGSLGTVCTVCGQLDDLHIDGPEPTFAIAREWMSKQMVSDLSGKNRTFRDWFSTKKLIWRIRRKKQMWGRQP